MLKNTFIPVLIIFMAQTPYNEIFSNISTYIPNFILEKLPNFIQDKSFDSYATILSILLLVIFYVPLNFQKIQSFVNQKLYTKYITISKNNKSIVKPNLPNFLFTNINQYRTLFDIGKELDQFYNLQTGTSFSLLMQGYWKGEFDGNNTKGMDRLTLLKNFHNTDCINKHFIFAYSYAKKPNIITDLPNGECRIDTRPVLPVPNANTDTWTNENCKEAFEVFVKKFQYSDSYFPYCIPNDLHPGFMGFKEITQEVLIAFLKKQNSF
jgi:hypothetical protein